ncbi:MAG: protein kinase [Myxococcaceae bacterium]
MNDEFTGNRRYTVTRLLGAGSWGRVYQAYDNERNAFVAVKLLSRFSPEALLRFKREFRALQSVAHPNLVTLYELLNDGDKWFFTMEYVEGRTFLDYVHSGDLPAGVTTPAPTRPFDETRSNVIKPEALFATVDDGPPPITQSQRTKRPPLSGAGVVRLRHALGQLVDGLAALHAAGKLHRDVKPSNVLVTRDGRVVLLDFGLVRELDESDAHQSQGLVVGTPAYMSPEQGIGSPVKESTDWYAVGVLLYEVLTAQVPFEGKPGEMMIARRDKPVPPPSSLADGVPEDLEKLCVDLLARTPPERPTGPDLQKRLVRPSHPTAIRPIIEPGAPLIGREGLLEQLRGAFQHVVKRSQPALVMLEGDSGLGKSALLARFLRELEQTVPDVVVLSGRCGETETVPFKAFDQVVDELCAHLSSLPTSRLEMVVPRDFNALVRLFPVLRRLDHALTRRRVNTEVLDSQEVRRRAFRALLELFVRLSEQAPVILAIDDLHWGDADSAALLEALLRAEEAPGLLVIGATRTVSPAGPGPTVKAFADLSHALSVSGRGLVQRLNLWPLTEAESTQLAQQLYEQAGSPAGFPPPEVLARESRGSPYLLEALASLARSEGGSELSATTLEGWVKARVESLQHPARRLLEVVSVANRPVPRLLAWHAAGLDSEVSDPLVPLKNARLVSTGGAGSEERLLPYDARIGAAVRDQLSSARRKDILLSLAQALESSGSADFETIADWWDEAGESQKAYRAANQAAERALSVLAFDRAVRLFDRALSACPEADRGKLALARADALAGAGLGREAADAYLELSRHSGRSEDSGGLGKRPTSDAPEEQRWSLELKQRAAEQLLYSGHIDEGIAVLEDVLRALGENPRASGKSAALGVAWARLRVRLRGISFEVLPVEKRDPKKLARVDAYWAAAKGFGVVDPIRGTGYQFTHYRVALDSGDPYRIARALALEAGFHALMGKPHAEECRRVLVKLRQLCSLHPHPHAQGLLALMTGCEALGTGRFAEAKLLHERGLSIFREKSPGLTWEIITSLQYVFMAMLEAGSLAELRGRYLEAKIDAEARHDVYATTNLKVRFGWLLKLTEDAPDQAEREIEEGLGAWSRRGYHTQHFWGLVGRVRNALYQGRAFAAKTALEGDRPLISGSGVQRAQILRVMLHEIEGAVASASNDAEMAKRAVEALRAEKLSWAEGLAGLIEAAAARHGGDSSRAVALLGSSAEVLEAIGAGLWANAARRWRGMLKGDAEGQQDIARTDAWLREQGVRNPAAFAGMLVPGPWVPRRG